MVRTILCVAATNSDLGVYSPSAKPRAQATQPLVAAIASKPASSNCRALRQSQAFGSSSSLEP